MRKWFLIIFAVMVLLTGCSRGTDNASTKTEKTELIVFAAASLQETLTEIGNRYELEKPDIHLVFNFDSSGELKKQIEAGAECDIFISAAPKQMNQLDISAGTDLNPDGLDYIDTRTRCDLLENKVALAVPEGNPKGVTSFPDMIERLKSGQLFVAIGNADVPVGQYTQKIFQYFHVDEKKIEESLTYGGNVKEVTSQISEAAADCGIIYATDAFSASLETVDTATKEMCGQVIYPAAVLKESQNSGEAGLFLAFLKGEEAGEIFASVGFTPLS